MKELFFLVEEDRDGGYTARGIGESIFTEADTMQGLKNNIKDAVLCHFDEPSVPSVVHLHVVRDEIMAIV